MTTLNLYAIDFKSGHTQSFYYIQSDKPLSDQDLKTVFSEKFLAGEVDQFLSDKFKNFEILKTRKIDPETFEYRYRTNRLTEKDKHQIKEKENWILQEAEAEKANILNGM